MMPTSEPLPPCPVAACLLPMTTAMLLLRRSSEPVVKKKKKEYSCLARSHDAALFPLCALSALLILLQSMLECALTQERGEGESAKAGHVAQ